MSYKHFFAVGVISVILLFFYPRWESPYEKFQKARYQARFNLATGRYASAAEQLFSCLEQADKNFFQNKIPEQNEDNADKARQISSTIFSTNDYLDLQISLSYALFKLHLNNKAERALAKAVLMAGSENRHTLFLKAMLLREKNPKAALQIAGQAAKTPMQPGSAFYKIYSYIQADAATNYFPEVFRE